MSGNHYSQDPGHHECFQWKHLFPVASENNRNSKLIFLYKLNFYNLREHPLLVEYVLLFVISECCPNSAISMLSL